MCSNLPGRKSNFVGPQNLPNESRLNNQSLQLGQFALDFVQLETATERICYEYHLHLLCLVGKPPCDNSTQTPLLLCPETCQAYNNLILSGLCDHFINRIRESLNRVDENFPEFSRFMEYLDDFNCFDPATYFQSEGEDCENTTTSCTNIFSPKNQGCC